MLALSHRKLKTQIWYGAKHRYPNDEPREGFIKRFPKWSESRALEFYGSFYLSLVLDRDCDSGGWFTRSSIRRAMEKVSNRVKYSENCTD